MSTRGPHDSLPAVDRTPTTPDGIGLPGYPSATAGNRLGDELRSITGTSSRQQERDAAVDDPPRPSRTITAPPAPVYPQPLSSAVEHRLEQAETALMAARRELTNALDWVNRALSEVRQAGLGK